MPPGTPPPSWWEQYGPIGIVALIALSALVMAVRQYLKERSEEQALKARTIAEQAKLIQDLQGQLVALAQGAHREALASAKESHEGTLEMMSTLRAEHEDRFQALLERHIAATELARDKTLELANAVTGTLQAVSRKMTGGGR